MRRKGALKDPLIPRDAPIPMEKWGKDHWSTLGYIETRVVDYSGWIANANMRADCDQHPLLINRSLRTMITYKPNEYPTLLREGVQDDHDDWDCLDDMEAAGIVQYWEVTETPPSRMYRDQVYSVRVRFTDFGLRVAAALRTHKASGGNFVGFVWEN